jgi:hypothetical protein
MNKGVLEAYLLANVHVLCWIEAGKDIPEFNMLFFRRCLSAVMELLRNTKVEPEFAQSLKIYNASRCSRSPRPKGEYINQGWVNNAAVQMPTMTKNALSMNFGRRFHKYLKRTYLIDGKTAYTAVHGILSHEPYVPEGTPLDAIIDEWQDRIPRDASGRLTDEPVAAGEKRRQKLGSGGGEAVSEKALVVGAANVGMELVRSSSNIGVAAALLLPCGLLLSQSSLSLSSRPRTQTRNTQ